MYNNDYMYAIERSPEYLAHYGIRGMKWGVRKAIASGNAAKLSKHYAKAQKKLAKLEKRAANSKKYAKRAALMGAGAAAAGGLAAAGTAGVSKLMNATSYGMSKGALGVGQAASRLGKAMTARGIRGGGRLQAFGKGAQSLGLQGATKVGMASNAVNKWGNQSSQLAKQGATQLAKFENAQMFKKFGKSRTMLEGARENIAARQKAAAGITNNAVARVGAGVIGAGLAAGAAKNAYRAATANKKAAKFRSEMNKAFAGTKYANGGNRQGKKRRR